MELALDWSWASPPILPHMLLSMLWPGYWSHGVHWGLAWGAWAGKEWPHPSIASQVWTLIVTTQEGTPLWTTIGQQISRWEHLYWEFEAEFEGDMVSTSPSSHIRVGSGKGELKTRSMWLLVGGHTQVEQCLDLEAQSVEYMVKKVISPRAMAGRSGVKEQVGDLVWVGSRGT